MEDKVIKNLLLDSNNLLVSTGSFFTLKQTLFENIGSEKTKGFLFRFGYEIGISADNVKEMQKDQSAHRGAKSMHAMYGHVRDVIIDPNFDKLLDGTMEKIEGEWIDSFEAAIYAKHLGQSTNCECYTLCGYVSGFLTNRYKHPLVAIETTCVARGDDSCRFEVRLEENWDDETIAIYKTSNILNELETTYDALLHHKQLLDRISTFHNNLTQSLIEKPTLQEIVQSAYQALHIPIIIENLHGEEVVQIGLSDAEKPLLATKQPLQYENKYSNCTLYSGPGYSKLTAPVFINKKHYANCSFIYLLDEIDEHDHLYLNRLSTVISLCLLYENAQIEEQERLTYTLLDRLIDQKFKTVQQLDSYLKFFPFKIEQPFSTMVIRVSQKVQKELFIDLHEQLLVLSKHFSLYKLPSIMAVIDESIIILNTDYVNEKLFAQSLQAILKQLEKHHPNYRYSLGVSKTFDSLLSFHTSLDEAIISERISKPTAIKYYKDLGFLGTFLANMSTEQLHVIAADMLQELYDFDDARKMDLLHTLHKYLANGQKLKETMEDLSISMGGLQYRIKQIEILLHKSLKDSSFAAYLLLILDALILLDELHF